MPSNEDLNKRQQARELRKAQRQQAVEKSHTEAANLSNKQAENQTQRAQATAAAAQRQAEGKPAPAPKPKPARKEQVAAAKKAAEVKAQQDAERMPEPVNVEQSLSRWDGRGSPPLHTLNAIAQNVDQGLRDEGKEIAQAAGKAAYEVYTGKLTGKRNRYSRMRAQIAAGEVATAQAATKQNQQQDSQ